MPSRDSDALHTLGLTAARWQAILNTAQDAIICISESGEITLFNACAERMFGYAADEVLGQNVRLLMPPPYRDEHDGYIRSYRTTGVRPALDPRGRLGVALRRSSGWSGPRGRRAGRPSPG
jgi:PAS domain-containing protein